MFKYNTLIRVRYAETDKMGVVHHSNYAVYLELARIEWLNALGVSYKSMEENGVMLPVYEMKFSFMQPAYFDDNLTIETELESMPGARISFSYKISNQHGKLITRASTTLVFVDMKTNRPIRCPQYILDILKS
ncbi:acyl-CoA thioesterase [Leeuwenhoekiella sp. A16]|uniref:acyl-CoA thioesterase n=1 Tax=unclassified Leeuwenhoekiella TaxID=2615029 RepID=UPI003A8087FB|tara:strand:+ start:421 stop:819 length:399 start_codon:yes stop_codon:yes gene_type:complete